MELAASSNNDLRALATLEVFVKPKRRTGSKRNYWSWAFEVAFVKKSNLQSPASGIFGEGVTPDAEPGTDGGVREEEICVLSELNEPKIERR